MTGSFAGCQPTGRRLCAERTSGPWQPARLAGGSRNPPDTARFTRPFVTWRTPISGPSAGSNRSTPRHSPCWPRTTIAGTLSRRNGATGSHGLYATFAQEPAPWKCAFGQPETRLNGTMRSSSKSAIERPVRSAGASYAQRKTGRKNRSPKARRIAELSL